MARLRIFVSSTFYDLKYIRANLEGFIKSFGYEPVLFESGDIGFHPDLPLDESCYKEIENSHMQILIIGGKYGSPATSHVKNDTDKENKAIDSVTKREFLAALDLNIPVYFFVENGVLAEYSTYNLNKNTDGIQYAHVDNENVFKLIELIFKKGVGNLIIGFTKFEDISNSLKNQWSHLFTDLLKNRKTSSELNALNDSLAKLNSVTTSLQTYSEAILKSVDANEFNTIKKVVDDRKILDLLKSLLDNKFIKTLSRTYDLGPERILWEIKISQSFENLVEKIGDKVGSGMSMWSSKATEEYNAIKADIQYIPEEFF